MKYRLGLDVGTNSLGWSVLKLDANDNICGIEAAGSRIFSDGRDQKTKATLAAERRVARSARRRRDRYKDRRTKLLKALTDIGLFPSHTADQKALQIENPLELRAKALKEQLTPHQIGRALFHINQRRGFQSNRKDRSEETTSGTVSASARMLLQEMELIDPAISKDDYKDLSKDEKKEARRAEAQARKEALETLQSRRDFSFGVFLYQRHQDKQPTRARPGAGEDGKLYDVYPTREIYQDEFDKIWSTQEKYHPALMTQDAKACIHNIIFYQRPLKAQERGKCAYMSEYDRTFRAMPSFQRYRIYQEVNNLEWSTATRQQKLIDYPEARNAIIDLLECPPVEEEPERTKAQVSFFNMKKILKNHNLAEGNFEFNLETPKRKNLDANLTSHIMQADDYVGVAWHEWDLQKQDDFISIILDDELDDEKVFQHLEESYGLDQHHAEKCMNALLVDGTASVSREAAHLMLAKMRDEVIIQPDAAALCAEEVDGFVDPMRGKKTGETAYQPEPHLPYYGEQFQDAHIIPGKRDPKDKNDDRKFFGGVTNPTVHIALNQIRQVVNELIDIYGHPHSISIELGRELPEGEKGRKDIEKEQKDNQTDNERLDKELLEMGQRTNRDNRLRLKLWEELGENPVDRRCPFSGEVIGIGDLFNGTAEIEHLIPFSISLDDSRANKVIATRRANRDKGQRTPFAAFGDSPAGYDWEEIFDRAQNLPKAKQWRFQQDAMEIWLRDHADFSARHLNDTRYIGRMTREYLQAICHIDKIDVVTGRLTALLRGHWGLNSILKELESEAAHPSDHNQPEEEQDKKSGKKNRDDHRHHAIDAIVIGMTSRSILQKVATEANRRETNSPDLNSLFPKDAKGHSVIDPWDGFRDEVKKTARDIIVSHKRKRKTRRAGSKNQLSSTGGKLLKAKAFGLIKPINEAKNKWETVIRHPIVALKKEEQSFNKRKEVEAIRDEHLRQQFLQAFDEAEANGLKGIEGVTKLAQDKGIRRLRCYDRAQTVIPIRDKTGKAYKAYMSGGIWGVEIYAFPEGHKKADKWEGVVITRFNANKPDFQPGTTYRPDRSARLVMRLQTNDCIEIEENGKKRLMRLQKMAQAGNLTFAPLHEANVAKRANDKTFKFLNAKASSLRNLKARKVHISPTGKLSYEARRKPRRKNKKG